MHTSDTERPNHRTGTAPVWAPASPCQSPTLYTLKSHLTDINQNHLIPVNCVDFTNEARLIRLPLFFTNRLTREREIVFCTSRLVDKSKDMIGSMKASGRGDVTVIQLQKAF